MAAVAFPLVATAVGAEFGLGAFAVNALVIGATAAGTFVDNEYVLPHLFDVPQKRTASPQKVGDIYIQGNSEGSQANEVYGRNARLAGTVIWQNKTLIKEIVNEFQSNYFSHFAVHICRTHTSQIARAWADSKLIYVAANRGVTLTDMYIRRDSNSIIPFGQSYFRLPNRGPFTDYTRNLKVGKPVTITGHPDPAHDGDYNVAYHDQFGLIINDFPLGEFPIDVTVGPQTMSFYQEEAAWDTRFQGITFYNGTDTQNPDPLLVSLEGGTYPAHRGDTYMVLEKMALKDWGNRAPAAFTFQVVEDPERTVGETIGMILEGANKRPDQFDTSALTEPDKGYVIHGVTSPKARLQPLMIRYGITAQEEGGKLYFFKKEDASIVDIPIEKFGAGESGGSEVEPFEIALLAGIDQPSEVSVSYSDPANNYLRGEKSDKRRTATLDRTKTINFDNITMSGAEARDIATRELYRSSAESETVTFSLPPSCMGVQEGDVVRTVYKGEQYTIRVSQPSYGANFLIRCQGIIEDRQTFSDINSVSEEPGGVAPTIVTLPNLTLEVMDLAPLRVGDEVLPGLYLAVAATDADDPFFGSSIFDSTDNTTFTVRTGSTTEFAMGETLTVLQDAISDLTFEYGYTVDVELRHGTMVSVLEADIIANAVNRWLVGDEILYVVNATLIGTRQYRLEGFLRGGRDTLDAAPNHAVGERVVSLDQNTINFLGLNAVDRDTTRYYKALSPGVPIASGVSQAKTIGLHTLRPFSPGPVLASYRGNGSLDLEWFRRTRIPVGLFPPVLPPVEGTPVQWEIEIRETPSGPVVRTQAQNDLTTWAYLRSEQNSDNVTVGGPFTVHIYQVTTTYGRGKPAIITI